MTSIRVPGGDSSAIGSSDGSLRRPTSVPREHAQPESRDTRSLGRNKRRQPFAATVLIDVDHLLAEMDARGITGRDLAKEAGISEGTIYNALSRRPVLVRNAKLIAGALQRLEVDPGLARLVLDRGSSAQLLTGRGS